MRNLKFLTIVPLLAASAFAQWDFSLTTNGAYYIKNKVKTGDEHFSQPTGPYDGVEALTQFNARYTIPTPLGESWLLKGANVKLTGSFELSPVTALPKIKAEFTPVPFLVFSAGAMIGSGWNVLVFEGLTEYDFNTADYESLTPFTHYYYDLWASATFQFDTGALIEGDWSHVVMVANYEVFYEAMTGVDDGEIWQWKETARMANGLQYYFTGVLGYQMPIALNMVGLMTEITGHFDKEDYGIVANRFDGDFTTVSLSGLFSFTLSERDNLTTLLTFRRNRSYNQKHDDEDQEPLLVVKGGEWSFYRIALSWAHKF
ncbi:MAG: hypothetical protein MJY98_03150 [Fibrobacter sp.]|nr:hypothetical protein [Fibrobacter sp.]